MANKVTVTMYHPKATESIEVMPSEVKNTEVNGWTTEKPKTDIPEKLEKPKKFNKSRS